MRLLVKKHYRDYPWQHIVKEHTRAVSGGYDNYTEQEIAKRAKEEEAKEEETKERKKDTWRPF
jgi:hypothetical protein